MARGLAHVFADQLLAAKWRIGGASLAGVSPAQPAAPYYGMLHNVDDPGPGARAGIINSARRVQISGAGSGQMVSSGAGTGQVESTGDTPWLSAADNQPNVKSISIWAGTGAATDPGGTLIHTGPCVGSYSIGDNPTIFAGDFTDAAVIT